MITPKLEQLIWEGKAYYRTYIAGGSERSVLPIETNRFIIITDITYFSTLPTQEDPLANYNTIVQIYPNGVNVQLTILGERGVNRLLFRNGYSAIGDHQGGDRDYRLLPIGSHCINTYLLHTTQVAFNFAFGGNTTANFVGIVPGTESAYQPPTDYGREGQPGSVPVTTTKVFTGTNPFENSYINRPQPGVDSSIELSFPVDATTQIGSAINNASWCYPFAIVSYVEVIGEPNNIGI